MAFNSSNGNLKNQNSSSKLAAKSRSPKKKTEPKRRDSKEIFKEMSKKELEILAIKTEDNKRNKSLSKQLKKKLSSLDNTQDDEAKTQPYKATSDIMDVLYRTVIPH